MAHPNGQNPYPGYGQPPAGHGGYPQAPHGQSGSAPYPMVPGGNMPSGPMPHPPPPPPPGGIGGSRALPIIVAGGLAVGVFGGLMIVRGTGESDAAVVAQVDAGSEMQGELDAGAGGATGPDAALTPDTAAVVSVDAAVPETVDAAPPEPQVIEAVVTFDVKPPEAKISVDGEAISGSSYTVELEPDSSVKLRIKAEAKGYRPRTLNEEISESKTVAIRLKKRTGGGGGRNNNNGGRRNNNSNDLIDIDD